jgi:hypothetical protein
LLEPYRLPSRHYLSNLPLSVQNRLYVAPSRLRFVKVTGEPLHETHPTIAIVYGLRPSLPWRSDLTV